LRLFLSVTIRLSSSGHYQLTYAQGIDRCNEIGLSVASVAQLNAARDQGFHRCSCGWLAGGTSGLVLQYESKGCTSYQFVEGVMTRPCTWRTLQNVWCAYNWYYGAVCRLKFTCFCVIIVKNKTEGVNFINLCLLNILVLLW